MLLCRMEFCWRLACVVVLEVWFRIAFVINFCPLVFLFSLLFHHTSTGQATARSYEVFVSRWVYLRVLGKEEGEGARSLHRQHKEHQYRDIKIKISRSAC